MVFFVLYAMLGLETALFLMPVFVACLFLVCTFNTVCLYGIRDKNHLYDVCV